MLTNCAIIAISPDAVFWGITALFVLVIVQMVLARR